LIEARTLVVRGARVHNLKNIDLKLPKGKFIVFTGVSGSGKSSLAFDTLYAEGQRRYVEALSTYARQFLGEMERPDVDAIEGLAPAISIEQRSLGRNPRSTVGTITEIYDYLRLLYARVGVPHCVKCGREIGAQTREHIIERIVNLPEGTRIYILAPLVRGRKGEFRDLFSEMLRQGFVRARVDGEIINLDEDLLLDRNLKHDIDVVVDRLAIGDDVRERVAESVETALAFGEGDLIVKIVDGEEIFFSSKFACTHCGISYKEPTPQSFSFNSPQGMCPECAGLGARLEFDPRLIVRDESKSIREGAIKPVGPLTNDWVRHIYEGVAHHLGFSIDTPWRELTQEQKNAVLYGLGDEKIKFVYIHGDGTKWEHYDVFEGVIPQMAKKYRQVRSFRMKRYFEQFMTSHICPKCKGARIKEEARAVRVGGLAIHEVCALTVKEAYEFFCKLQLPPQQARIAEDVLKEIRNRLKFLIDVGLHYITLDRSAPTLSGGEAQRIKLASQIGSGLVGVLYILDEPTIGLHPIDNAKLLGALCKLKEMGNTVIVVEHDEDTIRRADLVVDFGPGPGLRGGEIVAVGSPGEIARNPNSLTGKYLAGIEKIPVPRKRRKLKGKWLVIKGARHNNLKNIDVRIPLGVFVCVTGVSGSGKSSLIADILYEALARELHGARAVPGEHDEILGIEHIDRVINIDQSPIGRTPRSNPATYVKVFDHIRKLFSQLPQARAMGYKPGRFSFNVPGGRCEACEGNGAKKLEMEFLPDIWVRCPVCGGKRFNRETLDIKYKGKSIADVLDMTVDEAIKHFENIPQIVRILKTLQDVGLGYIKLGQPAPTLSGGEAQRVKLARELARPSTGSTLYILDEPTTGLHFDDVRKLLNVLHRFVDEGNTVVVIEHNPEIVKTADYIIDLGPEGGDEGGYIVAEGTPEEIAENPASYTGQVLREVLRGRKLPPPQPVEIQEEEGVKYIEVLGAQQHNLKNIKVRIPRDRMVVFSGVSGSGKTSLAIDTLYAEGQRRYVESLSTYARQFLGQAEKPKVEKITGLSPAIAIEQKTPGVNPRSTVGTITEIYDYLRLLYARIGQPYCYKCGGEVGAQTLDEIVDRILEYEGQMLTLLAPIEPEGGQTYQALFERAVRLGFLRVRVDGQILRLDEEIAIDKRRKHKVEIVVDRVEVAPSERKRIASSCQTALEIGEGMMLALTEDGKELAFSQYHCCRKCGQSYEELTPQSFSFNSPLGMCPRCEGLGVEIGVDTKYVVPSTKRSIKDGGVSFWGKIEGEFEKFLRRAGEILGFDIDKPFRELTPYQQNTVLAGDERWCELDERVSFQYRGVYKTLEMISHYSPNIRQKLAPYLHEVVCSACKGARIRPEAACVRLFGRTLPELVSMSIEEVLRFFEKVELDELQQEIAGELLREVRKRLQFLCDVGIGYITLDRRAPTLSGGEMQRIRLASQLGSSLTGVLYVLDEPTVGLHPRDNKMLLRSLTYLRDLGNTLVVVEHDRQTLNSADYIFDFGPGAGVEGGRIVAEGPPKALARARTSLTGRFLAGELDVGLPQRRRKPCDYLRIVGARHNNLKDITVDIPLGVFVCVTGVSGSGKSSLINDILYNALARQLHRAQTTPGEHDRIEGVEKIDKVINIDQSPIGASPRSGPATYVGVFDHIRELFARLPKSRMRGYTPGRFSFNIPGGRCEECGGLGLKRIEMLFLPDVWVRCEACGGKRYNRETLEVRYRGKSIADVLDMTVDEALELFENIPKIRHMLKTLQDVGLGYIKLGQAATTLSGGEAQRIKLARELARPSTGKTLYILDEPTTGLHLADIRKLIEVLQRLVDEGNTVIVIEHNLDVIKCADYIIDLGPEGGDEGGYLVAVGAPEEVAKNPRSYTGQALQDVLEGVKVGSGD